MSGNEFEKHVREIVAEREYIQPEAVNIVWLSKILRNNKAIAIGRLPGTIYEITYNGMEDEFYIDVYNKALNYVKK